MNSIVQASTLNGSSESTAGPINLSLNRSEAAHRIAAEIEGPMAIVILGGLVTSTALNLLVLPALAQRCGKFGKQDADLDEARTA